MTELTLFIDGASRGNPGDAGIGILIKTRGECLEEYCEYIGSATNNVAEYRALIRGLEMAAQLKAHRVIVFSDSELVVHQMNGVYKVKSEGLWPLYQTAQRQSKRFDSFQIRHVRREQNKEADRLANQGIEELRIENEELGIKSQKQKQKSKAKPKIKSRSKSQKQKQKSKAKGESKSSMKASKSRSRSMKASKSRSSMKASNPNMKTSKSRSSMKASKSSMKTPCTEQGSLFRTSDYANSSSTNRSW